ncbi:MAG: hypothetical protein V2A78_07890 [bacterium]
MFFARRSGWLKPNVHPDSNSNADTDDNSDRIYPDSRWHFYDGES